MMRLTLSWPVAAVWGFAAVGVLAQESVGAAGPGREWSVAPRLSVTETFTDNVRLSPSAPQSEQITEVSPGLSLQSQGRSHKAYLDVALTEIFYANDTAAHRTQKALNTFGTLEAVDNWLFIDFNGAITQQAISAFGPQLSGNAALNPNQTEVSSYRVSPYLRGQLGDWAQYEARYSRAVLQADASVGSGVAVSDGVVNISGNTAFRRLGWSAQAQRQQVDYSAGRPTQADQVNLGLSYALTPQFGVSATAGRESHNYTSLAQQSADTSAVGITWTPSELSRVSLSQGNRSFGKVHHLSVEHRSARTAWRFTDSRDVSATPSQLGFFSLGSIYELLFSQLASVEPNPTARARLVSAYLQDNAINPNAVVISSFLTSAVSLQRRQNLSFALLGARDTLTFLASRSESSRVDSLSTAFDDLTASTVVRQRGFSTHYAHRLTPEASLGVLWSRQNTSGSLAAQDSTFQLVSLSLTNRLSRYASASVGLQRVLYDNRVAPYAQNALTMILNLQF